MISQHHKVKTIAYMSMCVQEIMLLTTEQKNNNINNHLLAVPGCPYVKYILLVFNDAIIIAF